MAERSAIEWTEATWNPIAGCSVVSPGCTNCYAMKRVAPRLAKNPATPHYTGTVTMSNAGPVWTGRINVASDKVLTAPLRWKRPRMIFVNSTSDLFHESVLDDVIDRIFAVMAEAHWHTFQVLTKRSGRMRDYLSDEASLDRIGEVQRKFYGNICAYTNVALDGLWPLPNVWLGVSAERQQEADERIPDLLATPAAIRFVSAEPLLGPVDLSRIVEREGWVIGLISAHDRRLWDCTDCGGTGWDEPAGPQTRPCRCRRAGHAGVGLDWVIVGGESGPGSRPMHPDWARSIRDQCAAAGVPFFFKQWGDWAPWDDDNWSLPAGVDDVAARDSVRLVNGTEFLCVGKKRAGRLLDGVEHNAMPQPREVPAL